MSPEDASTKAPTHHQQSSTYDPSHLDLRYHQFSPLITYYLPILTPSPPQLHETYYFIWNDYREYVNRLRKGQVERDLLKDLLLIYDIDEEACESNRVSLVRLERIDFRLETIVQQVPLTVARLSLRMLHDSAAANAPSKQTTIQLDYVDFTWLPQFLFTSDHMSLALEYYMNHLQVGNTIHAAFNGENWLQGKVLSCQHIRPEAYNSSTDHKSPSKSKSSPSHVDLQKMPILQQLSLIGKHVDAIQVKWKKTRKSCGSPVTASEEHISVDSLERTTIDPQAEPVSQISSWELQELVNIPNWEKRLTLNNSFRNHDDLRMYFLERLFAFTSSKNHANLQYLNYRYPYPITAVLVHDRLNQSYYRNMECLQLDLVHLYSCLREDAQENRLNTAGKKAVKVLSSLVAEFNQLIEERKIDCHLLPVNPSSLLKRRKLQFSFLVPQSNEIDEKLFDRLGHHLGQTAVHPFSPHTSFSPEHFYYRILDNCMIQPVDVSAVEIELEDRSPFQFPIESKSLYVCKWQNNRINNSADATSDESSNPARTSFCAPNNDSLMNAMIDMRLTSKQRNSFRLLRTSIANALQIDEEKSDLDTYILENYSFLIEEDYRWCSNGFYFKVDRKVVKTERSRILCEVLHLCAIKGSLKLTMQHPCATVTCEI